MKVKVSEYVVEIDKDGNVVIPDKLTVDEASLEVWNKVNELVTDDVKAKNAVIEAVAQLQEKAVMQTMQAYNEFSTGINTLLAIVEEEGKEDADDSKN